MSKAIAVAVIGAAGAAWIFRTKIESALGISPSPAPADPTAAATAAAAAAAGQGATAAQQAAAAAAAVTVTVASTIKADSPLYHDVLINSALANSAAELAAVQAKYNTADSAFLLDIYQWNYYRSTGGSTQTASAPAGPANAMTASQYLALRQQQGMSTPTPPAANLCPPGMVQDAAGVCVHYSDSLLLAGLNTLPWEGLGQMPAEQISRIDPQILTLYGATSTVKPGSVLAYILGLGAGSAEGSTETGSDGHQYTVAGGNYTRMAGIPRDRGIERRGTWR